MSIFWNIKENGKDNNNDSKPDESYDNKIKSKQYKKRSESFLRLDDLDLDNIHIRNDVLLEIATFLARRWSDTVLIQPFIFQEKEKSQLIWIRKESSFRD